MSHNSKTSIPFKYSIYMHKCMPYIDSPFHSPSFPFKNKATFLVSPSPFDDLQPWFRKWRNLESQRLRLGWIAMDVFRKSRRPFMVSQQKITIIGWADPEKIVKAIKKTRKSAVICSHTEQPDQPAQETEPAPPEGEAPPPEGGAPPPEPTNPPTEPPPLPPDNPPMEEKPSPECADERISQSSQPSEPKEEIHVIYHHPPNYGHQYGYGHYQQEGNSAQWNAYPNGPGFRMEPPQPVMTHSYDTYKPLPYVPGFRMEPPQPVMTHSYNTYKPSPYVTEYAYPRSPPGYIHYTRPDHHSQVYYSGTSSNGNGNGNGNGNITSLFSEENPNACSIV